MCNLYKRALPLALVAMLILAPSVQQARGQPIVINETEKLISLDHYEGQRFGFKVEVDGDVAIIGAANDQENGAWTGASYVFNFDGSSWVQTQKLSPAVPDFADFFGASIGLDGNRALFGVSGHNNFRGAAYVFEFDGTSWVESAKLTSDVDEYAYRFGQDAALSGDVALVAAGDNDNNMTTPGTAYVFRFDGTSWVETDILEVSDGVLDIFDGVVAIDGNRALIGTQGTNAWIGAVYVFEYDGSSWSETAKLTASDGEEGDRFGHALAIDGDRILVGAVYDDDNGDNAGSAYVFDYDGATWNETAKLLPSETTPLNQGDEFGWSVALDGDRALIGARYASDDITGAAFLFEFDGTSWIETTKFTASDGRAGDNLGWCVELYGNRAYAGAYEDSESEGALYVFDIIAPIPDQIQDLFEDVTELTQEELISPRQGGVLEHYLKRTQAAVDREAMDLAIESLNDFVLGITNLINAGALPIEEGQPLIDATNALIAQLEDELEGTMSSYPSDNLIHKPVLDQPQTVALYQNRPNPFNPSTTIRFELAEPSLVRLSVFDMLGREVELLVDGVREEGLHEIMFNGSTLPNGIYLYRLESPAGSFTKTMVLLK